MVVRVQARFGTRCAHGDSRTASLALAVTGLPSIPHLQHRATSGEVIDGDGTVGISCGIPQVKLVGSYWLLSAFVEFLGPVSSRRPLNVRPARNIYVVSTSYAHCREGRRTPLHGR